MQRSVVGNHHSRDHFMMICQKLKFLDVVGVIATVFYFRKVTHGDGVTVKKNGHITLISMIHNNNILWSVYWCLYDTKQRLTISSSWGSDSILWQFHWNCSRYQSVKWVWKIHLRHINSTSVRGQWIKNTETIRTLDMRLSNDYFMNRILYVPLCWLCDVTSVYLSQCRNWHEKPRPLHELS